MNNKAIFDARQILEQDLQDSSYILNDSPLGHAATDRKIHQYLFTCVREKMDKVECRDWLFELYQNLEGKNKDDFQKIIHVITDALYSYDEFIKKN